MKERPILMSAPMVRACLREVDPKTQTRRAVKGVPSWDHYGRDIMDWGLSGIHQGDFGEMVGTNRWFLDVQTDVDDNSRREIRCPYGAPGDRLWVREAWTQVPASAYRMSEGVQQTVNPTDPDMAAIYAAGWDRSIPKWKPSIHMPRWACRLVLEITEVRVERLNDISEADAIAEGLVWTVPGMWSVAPSLPIIGHVPQLVYRDLWEHINGAGSWATNPFVWCVSFKRLDDNTDRSPNDQG